MEVQVNKHGVNKDIHATILSNEEMKKAGFKEYNGKWIFFKIVDKKHEIGFYVEICGNEQEDLNIMVLDEDFCQPYDYQSYLMRRPSDPLLLGVQESVEQYMKQLEHAGILSGHVRGEYI